MSWEQVKRAREAAIEKALTHIEDGMVIGFGTGSTMAQAAQHLKQLIEEKHLNILFIPTSIQSRQTLLSHDLPITTLHQNPEPDLTIDSFDQVDREGNAIKGGGAALLMEKVLAQASRKVIYIGDHLKLSPKLDKPIPIEVLDQAYPHVQRTIKSLGMKIRLREAEKKAGPVISDNGNPIADIDAGTIEDPEELDRKLKSIAGILETGIFPKLADKIIIGHPDKTTTHIIPRKR